MFISNGCYIMLPVHCVAQKKMLKNLKTRHNRNLTGISNRKYYEFDGNVLYELILNFSNMGRNLFTLLFSCKNHWYGTD